MQKNEKEQMVAELTERLRTAETLIVADYRGLTNSEIDDLRSKLIEHGARFSVVKNTLTRRAAEAAGADALLALLEGPTAIAFVESEGDAVAVAKALSQAARDTKILAIRGGVLQGASLSTEEIERLAKLPPAEVVRAQLLGTLISPLTTVVALVTAPLRDLVGLIDARIAQLQEQGDTSGAEAAPVAEAPAESEPSGSEPRGEAEPVAEAAAEPVAETERTEASGSEPHGEAEPVTDAAAEPAAETEEPETSENEEEKE
jgi:large subunit ribosomal protein L10